MKAIRFKGDGDYYKSLIKLIGTAIEAGFPAEKRDAELPADFIVTYGGFESKVLPNENEVNAREIRFAGTNRYSHTIVAVVRVYQAEDGQVPYEISVGFKQKKAEFRVINH